METKYDPSKKGNCPKCGKEVDAIFNKREDEKGEYLCLTCGKQLIEFKLK